MSRMSSGLEFVALLFLGMLVMLELGRRIRLRQKALHGEATATGFGAVEGAIFALMGLLVAFTFSGAAARFDARRGLIVEEANDIGTAYLRLDLLQPAAQPPLREKFRQYVDARLESYRFLRDRDGALAAHHRALALQGQIWQEAVAASQQASTSQAGMLLLPALNQMIDISTTRFLAMKAHPPFIIFGLLGVVSLATALLAGYGMAESGYRSRLHIVSYALILTITVYVIFDLEFPRQGLIRVEGFDQALVDVRESMR